MTASLPATHAGRWSVATAIVLAGLGAALAIAAGAGATIAETVAMVAMAAGSAVVVAGLAAAMLVPMRRRGLALHVFGVAAGAVVAVAAGVGVAAWAMFLSAHDLAVLAVVLVLSGAVATAAAWLIGQSFRASAGAIASQISRLEEDRAQERPEGLLTRELNDLSDAVASAHEQLQSARDQAVRLERSRRELVAWVSHDLRSPIAAIRAMAEALEDGVVSVDDEVVSYHRAIRQEAERLGKLVDDLFELARIEAGAIPVDSAYVPLQDLVAEVVELAEVRAETAGVHLVVDVAPMGGELVVAADLRRALDNLVDNAIRHTARGSGVSLRASLDPAGAVLVVADECGGIPEAEIGRVFEVAYRGDSARSGATGGGGLGLAIARGVVEACSGRISVANRGEGCEFTIALPASSPRR